MRPLFERYLFESPIRNYILLLHQPIYNIIYKLKPFELVQEIEVALDTEISWIEENIIATLSTHFINPI